MRSSENIQVQIIPICGEQRKLNEQLELCRDLYNSFLEQMILAHEIGKDINYNYQQNQIPELKNTFRESKQIHSQVLQDVARRVDRAYQNFFRRVRENKNEKKQKAGFPKFRPRQRYRSRTIPQSGFHIMENGHLKLSKIGELRMFQHRSICGEIRALITAKEASGKGMHHSQ